VKWGFCNKMFFAGIFAVCKFLLRFFSLFCKNWDGYWFGQRDGDFGLQKFRFRWVFLRNFSV
jgi:hypothetical protein